MATDNDSKKSECTDTGKIPASVILWLQEFTRCIRQVDYSAARRLFSPDVYGFGTRARSYQGIDDCNQNQWKHIWPKTKQFTFEIDKAHCLRSPDHEFCCLAIEWNSLGTKPDGSEFLRRGRCTLILAADTTTELGWVAKHSHFSMIPDG